VDHLVPWTIRHGTAIWVAAIPVLLVVCVSVVALVLRARMRRKAREALTDIDRPEPNAPDAAEGALVVVVGRLGADRAGKPVAAGVVLLATNGDEKAEFDGTLFLERQRGRLALVGPFQILVGARESFPVRQGRRLLHVGDEILVSGRWSSGAPGDTTYRAASATASIVPAADVLDIASLAEPEPIGLRLYAAQLGALAAVVLWGLVFIGGASGALLSAYGQPRQAEARMFTLASLAYASPITQRRAGTLLLMTAAHSNPRETPLSERWAAAESSIGEEGECLGVLENLRATGRLEDEARIGVRCGGPGSRRRGAEAHLLNGEFAAAAEILRETGPLEVARDGVPDARLDVRVALFTGDLVRAAALLRKFGHPILKPEVQNCVALGLEARAGNAVSRMELRTRAGGHWTCSLLHTDLLEGQERVAFIDTLGSHLLTRLPGRFFAFLRAEADPPSMIYVRLVHDDALELFGAPEERGELDPLRAVRVSVLKGLDAIADPSPSVRDARVNLGLDHAIWAAYVGDEAESMRRLDLVHADSARAYAERGEIYEGLYLTVLRTRAAIAVRFAHPKAIEYAKDAGRVNRFLTDWQPLMGALAVRENEGGVEWFYDRFHTSPKLAQAISSGDASQVLEASPRSELLTNLVIAAPRLTRGRPDVAQHLRWYDIGCASSTCRVEHLAAQAAVRALILSHMRMYEDGFEEYTRVLTERARRLREPPLRRDIAIATVLVENPYPMDWW
jgi:hypothetical protein